MHILQDAQGVLILLRQNQHGLFPVHQAPAPVFCFGSIGIDEGKARFRVFPALHLQQAGFRALGDFPIVQFQIKLGHIHQGVELIQGLLFPGMLGAHQRQSGRKVGDVHDEFGIVIGVGVELDFVRPAQIAVELDPVARQIGFRQHVRHGGQGEADPPLQGAEEPIPVVGIMGPFKWRLLRRLQLLQRVWIDADRLRPGPQGQAQAQQQRKQLFHGASSFYGLRVLANKKRFSSTRI